MADNRYKDFTDEAIKQLERLEEKEKALQKKIDDRNKKKLNDQAKIHQKLLAQLDETKKEIDEINEREQQRLTYARQLSKENLSYFRSISKIAPETRKLLGFEKNITQSRGVFSSLSKDVIEMKAQEANLNDDELETSVYRRGILEEQLSAQQSQAAALVRAKKEENELSQFKEQQTYYDSLRGELGDEIVDKLIQSNKETENLFKQEQRVLELRKQQEGLLNQMPEPIKNAVEMAKGLGTAIKAGLGPLFIIGAVITAAFKSFTDLEDGAEEFRKTTGLTNSQMKDIRSQANQITQEFADTGLAAKDVFNTVASLKQEFSDISNFSNEVVAGLTLLNTNFGVTTENAGKVQGIFEQIGGLSSETATSLQLQVANLANMAGVAPAKVFEDIAENAEAASKFFRGDIKALAASAVQARRLGSNLKSVVTTTEKLLDFESGISAELEASAFVGGQFNLTRARGLAAAGKEVEAQQEILNQLQRSGDFRKQDYFTQTALANAAGMEVAEINKLITNREKLNSLSGQQLKLTEEAMKNGLDISNINKEDLATQVEAFSTQQEQQKVLDKIANQFTGIASTIGSVLIPLLDGVLLLLYPIQLIVDGIKWLFGGIGKEISKAIGPLNMFGKIIKAVAGGLVIWAALATYAGMASFLAGTIVGAPLIPFVAGAAAAAVLTAGFGILSKIGDLNSPATGKTIVSTKEGGLFELSPNDDLIAAPGASRALQNMSQGSGNSTQSTNISSQSNNGTDKLISTIERLEKAYMKGSQVNLDGVKVTNRLGVVINDTTRNNFSLL